MQLKYRIGATVVGLALLGNSFALPAFAQEVVPAVTQEDDTPSYDLEDEPSTPDTQEATPQGIEPGEAAGARVDYSRLTPKPLPKTINPGLTSPSARYMKSVLGVPGALTTDCSPVTNSRLKRLLVTEDVGPFKVTGLKPAIAALKRIFAKVKQEKPALYAQLGTAGMLCVRKVRGGSNFSNHSWGTAIDLKINRKLDRRGDNKTQVGLKELYPYFHRERFYWGAEFPTEDSMHFEASKELVAKWKQQGQI